MVVVTAIKRVTQDYFGFETKRYRGLDGGYQRIGVALMGRFHLYMRDRIEGWLFLRGIGLHDLNMITLALMAAVSGIRVGRILEGVGGDLLGAFQFNGMVLVFDRITLLVQDSPGSLKLYMPATSS